MSLSLTGLTKTLQEEENRAMKEEGEERQSLVVDEMTATGVTVNQQAMVLRSPSNAHVHGHNQQAMSNIEHMQLAPLLHLQRCANS